MLRRVALVRTDVSEELSTSFTRVTRIGELGTALDVTSTDAHCEKIPSRTLTGKGQIRAIYLSATIQMSYGYCKNHSDT
jgi:hypothetical protein